MPAYSGKFQYRDKSGAPIMMGPCNLRFDAETCTVTPESGAPVAFDLGDVDCAAAGEFDLQLSLYTGRVLQLRQFGAVFSQMAGQFMTAWRDRTVRCMLLEDLAETMRCPGAAAFGRSAATPAEIRLYRTNIAVLPASGAPFQWRLADVESVSFDEAAYSIALKSAAEVLVLSKLARKTEELLAGLRAALNEMRRASADALHDLFPFLDPDRLQRLAALMPEGRSVRLASLAAVHPKVPEALLQRAVDGGLRPYFEALRSRAAADSLMAGFKFIRKEEEAEAPEGEAEAVAEDEPSQEITPEAAPEGEEKQPLFFWFFFPLAGAGGRNTNLAAWEAATGGGRATYFFRLPPSGAVEEAVERITRALALVNFRREPVYLAEESLERQPRFHRYAIAARKLPELRALRESFAGRAMHTSLEQWTAQVEGIAARR
jgi:hypothetical protein